MATVISFINLKGGVGKSTVCVALAEVLSGCMGKRVLVIDMDPQTNTTIALIGAQYWAEVDRQGQTIYHMFAERDIPDWQRRFSSGKAIISHATHIIECGDRLCLLPSSTQFIGKAQLADTMVVLAEHLSTTVLDQFDYVLIDCPPNLDIITQNGIYLSDMYLIPVIPEPVSLSGISQIMEAVRKIRNYQERPIPPLGIVVNAIDEKTNIHRERLETLQVRASSHHWLSSDIRYPAIIHPLIPRYTDAALIMEFPPQPAEITKWYGRQNLALWKSLATACLATIPQGKL